MPFAIMTFDKPHSHELRTRLRAEHLDYLMARKDVMLAGGAMLAEDGRPEGGLIIIDTEDQTVAESFAAGDPFNKGGLFREVKVVKWRKSFFNLEYCA